MDDRETDTQTEADIPIQDNTKAREIEEAIVHLPKAAWEETGRLLQHLRQDVGHLCGEVLSKIEVLLGHAPKA